MACRGAYHDHGFDGDPFDPMARYGRYRFADRAVGGDVHDPTRHCKRRRYLFCACDTFNVGARAMGVRLGLSYCGVAGLLCVAAQ